MLEIIDRDVLDLAAFAANQKGGKWKYATPEGRQVQVLKLGGGYMYEERLSALVVRSKLYWSTGKLFKVGLADAKTGYPFGVWQQFSERGVQAEVVNHDRHYRRTRDEIVSFLKKQKIPYNDALQHSTINRFVDHAGHAIWVAAYKTNYKTIEQLYLDDRTLKVVRKERLVLPK